MATLVLSTVGTALGGPVGSAIGALIGQSIDQELLAPVRRGPRVDDLRVQTSTYGTQVPRIYGTMRVAGSVIWATDLIERSNTGGGKGQPDVTYSYTISMAVALSSRPAHAVRRIWADGKLLRGAAGDFKVGTKFRFYEGGEDQEIDPLIGSVEGIANSPAYRGLALCVFEDLELAEYGNRIPFLSFEVEADDGSLSVGAILADASSGTVVAEEPRPLIGYAAYGPSIRSAIEPLIDSFGVDLLDDGELLRSPQPAAASIVADSDLGNSADPKAASPLDREQIPARESPAALRLTYYERERDFQTGEARASAGQPAGKESQRDLPGVMSAADAKALAQEMIARSWANRDRVTVRLPPSQMFCEPGRHLQLALCPARWKINRLTIDSFVVILDLGPATTGIGSVPADGGRIANNPDEISGPLTLALLDIPSVLGGAGNDPMLLLAASSGGSDWKRQQAQIDAGGREFAVAVAPAKSLLGRTLGGLQAGTTDLIDDEHSVEVELADPEQWLTACDDEALAAGMNLAVIGNEVCQFARVDPLGNGRFRLSRLLRGRAGTEWACEGHSVGDVFCVVRAGTLQALALPSATLGAMVTASVGEVGVSETVQGEGLRPPAPVALIATRQPNGDLKISWTRRSRLGFAWVDGVDAPLGEALERYRVVVTGPAATLELWGDQPELAIAPDQLATAGSGVATVAVQQIGDLAASRPAQIVINLA